MMNSSIETYKIFSEFYDLYVRSFNSDFDFYRSFCHKTDRILEVGCGTGRILNILLQEDCTVTGIDISEEMLTKAGEKYHTAVQEGRLTLLNHNFLNHKLNAGFDRILLSFYTFNYILDQPKQFLKSLIHSFNSGGVLLMDVFYPTPLFNNSIDGVWLEKEYNIDGRVIKIHDCRTMNKDIEHRQQVFIIDGTETKIDTKRRYYSPSVLREILHDTGIGDVKFAHGYEYQKFQEMIEEKKLKNNYIVKVTV